MLNKVILLLNATVLLVTFVLVLSSQGRQADLALASAGAATRAGTGPRPGAGAALRLLQSLEQYAPRERIDALSGAQVRALFEALDHHAWLLEEGMEDLRRRGEDGAKTRAAVEELGKRLRLQVQGVLERQFREAEFVNRVTAAILGGGR
ncbi:MAG: hypothetical protein ACT4PV_13240 [Planctomycetaceae bacterium]